MSVVRRIGIGGVASAFAVGLLFACADSESDPPADTPGTDAHSEGGGDPVFEGGPDVNGVVPGQCSEGGFCYVSVPVLQPIVAVSASSVDDAWMLPEGAQTILHWDGSSLEQVYEYSGVNPAQIELGAIWARKKDDVWAVGSDKKFNFFVVRYSSIGGGEPAFREHLIPEHAPNYRPGTRANSLWAPPESDVLWIAAEQAIVRVRDDGSGTLFAERFTPVGNGGGGGPVIYQWYSVWGFGPNDVYVGGLRGGRGADAALAHYDGTSWTVEVFDSYAPMLSLQGTLAGATRQLWMTHWWDDSPTRTRFVTAVDGGVGDDLFTALSPACTARMGSSVAEGAWFSNGLLVCRWTGSNFEAVPTSLGGRPIIERVNAVWAGSDEEAWIVGELATGEGGFAAMRTRETANGGKR